MIRNILLILACCLPMSVSAQWQNQIRMGVLLPFTGSESRTQKMVEFYRGVLMAVDSISSSRDVTIDVTTVDSGTTPAEMERVLATNPSLAQCHIIVGPQASQQVPVLMDFCQHHGVRLVVPFSDMSSRDVGYNVFVVSSGEQERLDNGADFFVDRFRHDHIVRLIGVEGVKGSFASRIANQCAQEGIPVATVDVEVDDEAMIAQMDTTCRNVVLVGGGDLAAVNRVMARMDALTGAYPSCRVTIVGGFEWQNYVQQHLHNYYKYDVYIPSLYFYNSLYAANVAFENVYMRQFGTQMISSQPRFAPMGFDVAYFFLDLLADYGADGTILEEVLPYACQNQKPLQHGLSFELVDDGGWMNRACRYVHYRASGIPEMIGN